MQPTLWQLTGYFFRLGATGFGGAYALVAMMRNDLVEGRKWFSASEYEEGFAFSQIAPGPVAPQLAMYLGYGRYGILGATLSLLAFIFVPFLLVVGLAVLYRTYGELKLLSGILYGIAPAVVALVAHAAAKLGHGMLRGWLHYLIAVLAFLTAIFLHVDLSFLIIGAGLVGMLLAIRRHFGIACLGVIPLTAAATLFFQKLSESFGSLLVKLGWFFFKAGALTFGSGYVIVAFMQKAVVDDYGWLTTRQFLDGVAAGQITPGPVVITSSFVGYMVAGFPGALVSTVSVFAPVYLITILLAPLVSKYRTNEIVRGFMTGANAAAVGAIAGVAVLMGEGAVTGWPTALIAVGSVAALYFWDVSSIVLVAAAGGVGALLAVS
jgi:chromate transporter